MNPQKRARRESLRVLVSEAIMVITIAITVIVLAFVVSGYWLNSDFELQRQGMLQVYSYPTGASVEVDGGTLWLQRTNTSKVLPSGEHTVVLSKEGYDSWSKTIVIQDGLLYRLRYPRLFPIERSKEPVFDASAATFATVSPDRKTMLLAGVTSEWTLLRLDSEEIKSTPLDLSRLLSSVSLADGATTGLFTGRIASASWSHSSGQVLLAIENGTSEREWVVLNVRNPANSINLTREFATSFSEVRIADDSASTLFALRDGNLLRIDVPSRQISAVILEQVESYDVYESEILYFIKGELGLLKIGESEPNALAELPAGARVFIIKFYDEQYIVTVVANEVAVYKKSDFTEILHQSLSFTPETTTSGRDGEFVFMAAGPLFATLDMEVMSIKEWSPSSENYGWLTGDMIYAVDNGVFSVYDFDGLNHRQLATNASEHFPATITNDKWLYYFSDGMIIREWLVEK